MMEKDDILAKLVACLVLGLVLLAVTQPKNNARKAYQVICVKAEVGYYHILQFDNSYITVVGNSPHLNKSFNWSNGILSKGVFSPIGKSVCTENTCELNRAQVESLEYKYFVDLNNDGIIQNFDND